MSIDTFLLIFGLSLFLFMFFNVLGDTDTSVDVGDNVVSEVLSLKNLLLFGIGFGALGGIATYLGAGPLLASGAGLLTGVGMVVLGVLFYRAVRGQQANSSTSLNNLIGKTAVVSTRIPVQGMGEITTQNEHGTQIHLTAQSESSEIQEGTVVIITAFAGSRAIVKPN